MSRLFDNRGREKSALGSEGEVRGGGERRVLLVDGARNRGYLRGQRGPSEYGLGTCESSEEVHTVDA